MTDPFVWYDSSWLRRYVAAKRVISQVAPKRLDDFVSRMKVFRTDPGFKVREAPGFLGAETRGRIKDIIQSIPLDQYEMHELKRFGRLVVHDHPEFTKMQMSVISAVSEMAGEAVEPSYNFLSLYSRLGRCEPHLDSPFAKWTLDMCLDQSDPWPIFFTDVVDWPESPILVDGDWQNSLKSAHGLHFEQKSMTPGDAILFSGSSQWHYRNEMISSTGKAHCDLLFFHFIPAGASDLVRPANWARIFDIPELGQIPGMNEEL